MNAYELENRGQLLKLLSAIAAEAESQLGQMRVGHAPELAELRRLVRALGK